jgi:uncharacterized protein (TIGR02996 family)
MVAPPPPDRQPEGAPAPRPGDTPPMPALTDDERALLRAVIADPDADLPRLVYADFLDDRCGPGDAERANLIRYQMAHPDQEMGMNSVLLPELPGNALASVRRGFAV